ncbi:MAG: KpsF/GutQ family sugar-phosphate isomerase [Rikenellaceae bacterium]|jgi:arabinose-5-phosphate isomerase|nr:KpsF/GutQ family sugar-phosphate isomerase [Rikenellaceae bacterium]
MSDILKSALDTVRIEAAAISGLAANLTDDFEKAVRALLACRGKVIVTGMGKSGLIGRKIAATLSSTGTSSFFLHPGEAYHGDLGMIARSDALLAISNSGNTDEILKLIPFLEDNGNVVVSMTGNPASTLARHSTCHLNIAVAEEACPLSLAPTSSTTATLVMGDALAVALMHERGFRAEDFARFHPGGTLGRRLLTRVGDVMRSDNLPVVPPTMKLGEVIIAISDARLGVAIIVDGRDIRGVVTDGDVRRAMLRYRESFFDTDVAQIMTRTPKTVSREARITEAEQLMQHNKIHSLIVTGPDGELAGIVELYDLMP